MHIEELMNQWVTVQWYHMSCSGMVTGWLKQYTVRRLSVSPGPNWLSPVATFRTEQVINIVDLHPANPRWRLDIDLDK